MSVASKILPIVGILGDGQLAMMMAEAYSQLGGKTYIFAANNDGPASSVADSVFVGSLENNSAVARFFNAVDVVTLENEFNDGQTLIQLSADYDTPIYPDPNGFDLIGDKLSEKLFFASLGISQAEFLHITGSEVIPDRAGYLKLAKGGYDGIGTYHVNDRLAAIEVFERIRSSGAVLYEAEVDFKKELSLIAVSDSESVVFYPLVETIQEDGTCRYVRFPAGVSDAIEQEAQRQVGTIMRNLNTKGLFAFELFLTQDDSLILNESAPRPHNSGHITLNSMNCSQFENHMRAVAGLKLVQPEAKVTSMTMLNLLGTQNAAFDPDKLVRSVNDANTETKLYGKAQTRVKRKMGHINLWGRHQMARARKLASQLEV